MLATSGDFHLAIDTPSFLTLIGPLLSSRQGRLVSNGRRDGRLLVLPLRVPHVLVQVGEHLPDVTRGRCGRQYRLALPPPQHVHGHLISVPGLDLTLADHQDTDQ